MFRKIFYFIFLFGLCWSTKVWALYDNTSFVKLKVIPEYSIISQDVKNVELLLKGEIKENWHVYWDNPGDVGVPTSVNFYDNPKYRVLEEVHSKPKKEVFDEIITSYVYEKDFYFRVKLEIDSSNVGDVIPVKMDVIYNVCNEECFDEIQSLSFDLRVDNNTSINNEFVEILSRVEKEFLPVVFVEVKKEDKQFEFKLNDDVLNVCSDLEFVSKYIKKRVLSENPSVKIDGSSVVVSYKEKDDMPKDVNGIIICGDNWFEIRENKNNLIKGVEHKTINNENKVNGVIYYILIAFLAGLILNLMPCVLPVLSLKALYLVKNRDKASKLSSFMYLIGVIASFVGLGGVLYYFKGKGEELGWGFQLQSVTFNIVLLLLFFVIFLCLLDKIHISDKLSSKLSNVSFNNSFLAGFFAVIVATPCSGPFMGGALGYAMMVDGIKYWAIFVALGLGYGLPYSLVELRPEFFLKYLPKSGEWMIKLKKFLAVPIGLTCLWLGWVIFNQFGVEAYKEELKWNDYSKKAIEKALENEDRVFINFTAKWCLVCLLNDKTTFSTNKFDEIVKDKNVKLFKADWTNKDKEISEGLKKYGRNSVPLYVYYEKGGKDGVILPQILTINEVKKYFK